MLAQNNS